MIDYSHYFIVYLKSICFLNRNTENSLISVSSDNERNYILREFYNAVGSSIYFYFFEMLI